MTYVVNYILFQITSVQLKLKETSRGYIALPLSNRAFFKEF